MKTARGEIETLKRKLAFFQFQCPAIDVQLIQPVETAYRDFEHFTRGAHDSLPLESLHDLHAQSVCKMVVTSAGECERIQSAQAEGPL
jgi:hypothetical protein